MSLLTLDQVQGGWFTATYTGNLEVASLNEEARSMLVTLDPRLEAALKDQASHQGIAPEELALKLLRERLMAAAAPEPLDKWERELLGAARPWGVSLPDAALTSEELYE